MAGTDQSNTYLLTHDKTSMKKLTAELKRTCHYAPINDIIFPKDCSQLFLTSSANDIRVWNADTKQELLRIQVMGR